MMNFGITSETSIDFIGSNAKMNELNAAVGIHSLGLLDLAMQRRGQVSQVYRELLRDLDVIRFFEIQPNVRPNYQYFPIFLPSERHRNTLHAYLLSRDIQSRRYFFPALHQVHALKRFATAPLPISENIASRILCLPLHSDMSGGDVFFIVEEIRAGLQNI